MIACACDCHKLENVMPCQFCVHRHAGDESEHLEAFLRHRADCAQCQVGAPCKEGDAILRTGFPF